MNLDALIGQWNSLDDLLFRTFFAKTRQTITDIMLTLTSCTGDNLVQLTIAGNSEQDGTPTPENPIPITNVGTLISEGEHAGKYAVEVEVEVSDSEEEPTQTVTKTIYLDEPLRKGDTLNLVSGTGMRYRVEVDLGTQNFVRSNDMFYARITTKKFGKHNLICDKYKVSEEQGFKIHNLEIAGSDNNNAIYVNDSAYTDADALKTAMSGVKLEYELATPVPFTFTPVDIPTFSGTTIIRVNSVIQPESMTATYWQEG